MKKVHRALLENAIDFLEKSLEEFKTFPKYSVLHFAIAVEIFLKARLVEEHWSLVVDKNADRDRYLKGDFVSVNLDEAIKRLKSIVGENISESESQSFKKLAAHRNKVIHFYHGELKPRKSSKELESIIREQCECWYHLKTLFTKKWHELFKSQIHKFESLDLKMKRHWEYLSTIFNNKREELEKLKKSGTKIGVCKYCSFDAVAYEDEYEELSGGTCYVCGHINTILTLMCDCGNSITFHNEGWGTCAFCEKEYEPEDVYNLIEPNGKDHSEWPESVTPANCSSCDGYHTIAAIHDKFICTSCFDVFDHLETCEWCNEYSSGDMSGSYWSGCSACDGKSGWEHDD